MVTSTHNFFCLKVAIGALVLFDSFLIFEITLFRAEDDCKDVSSWPLDTNKGKVIWSP